MSPATPDSHGVVTNIRSKGTHKKTIEKAIKEACALCDLVPGETDVEALPERLEVTSGGLSSHSLIDDGTIINYDAWLQRNAGIHHHFKIESIRKRLPPPTKA